ENIGNQLPLIHEIHDAGLLLWGQPDFMVQIVRHDDPIYPEQFQMNNVGGTLDGFPLVSDIDIDAPEAWAITTGNNTVTVAVIDDGLLPHPDLPNIVAGFTPANNGNGSATNSSFHGEPCAGIIAAQHNDIGVRGVAPNVNLIAVNIFQGGESIQDLADAFNFAVNQGADVISNSWGFSGNCSTNLHPTLTAAINNAVSNGRGGLGCPVLFSSGNDFNSCVSYPSSIASVMSVGSVSPDGDISVYSNQGNRLDIVAPSNDFNSSLTSQIYLVRSTDLPGNTPGDLDPGDYTDSFGGTSAACPVVAGVAALVLSVDGTLTSNEVYEILTSTADDMGASGFDNTFGFGRVNAFEAVLAAGATTPPTCNLSAPANFSASGITDTGFTLSWSAVPSAVSYTVTVAGTSSTISGTSFAVTGLTPGTTYASSVVANCTSGSGSVSSITVTTTGTDPACEPISFTGETLISHSMADDGIFTIVDDASVLLEENTWRALLLDYTVTANTVIDFEFQSTGSEGEIHGIAFASSTAASSNLTFKVFGTQNWGITNFDNYSGSGVVSYSIPVGDFYTGSFDRLVFVNDNDGGSGNNSLFQNIVIHEGECSSSTASLLSNGLSLEGNETKPFDLSLFPVPALNELTIEGKFEGNLSYTIISMSGKMVKAGMLEIGKSRVDITSLPGGTYFFKAMASDGNVIKRFTKE
ncbi:MAG: S8 family serine peptidase, partial [Bacteroidota bacterium]